MLFNEHYRLSGKHSRLSPSNHSWMNYSNEKMVIRLRTMEAAARGTRLHDLASQCIKEGIKLQANGSTLSMYVNDAIGFRMKAEQVLWASDNCFGTCDAIDFRKGKLRIHDLKTGETPAHFEQLLAYAAIFCIEYNIKPYEIEVELRIYQNKERVILIPEPEEIVQVMDTIKRLDRVIDNALQEELA